MVSHTICDTGGSAFLHATGSLMGRNRGGSSASGSLSLTADTYTHVLSDGAEIDHAEMLA